MSNSRSNSNSPNNNGDSQPNFGKKESDINDYTDPKDWAYEEDSVEDDQLRKLAGWGLIALLIAVYPANIHMAVNSYLFPDISQTMLYFRLLLQFLFAYWVYRTTISKNLQVTH